MYFWCIDLLSLEQIICENIFLPFGKYNKRQASNRLKHKTIPLHLNAPLLLCAPVDEEGDFPHLLLLLSVTTTTAAVAAEGWLRPYWSPGAWPCKVFLNYVV